MEGNTNLPVKNHYVKVRRQHAGFIINELLQIAQYWRMN
jgi:hypothetical protein